MPISLDIKTGGTSQMSTHPLPNMPQIKASDICGPFDATGILSMRVRRHREFGLYDEKGIPVPNGDVAGNLTHSTPLAQSPGHMPEKAFDGPVLFAGLAPQQFGHAILNSLGRLWALDYLPSETALLYLPQIRAIPERYPYVQPLLEMLGVTARLILHDKPTRYRSLFTAEDHFGERHGGKMNPKMRDWLARRLPPKGPFTSGRSVYFTRSRLGSHAGRYCNEEVLEQLLVAAGYEIVAPELLSLPDQVAVMQDAENLVFAEGSALHLYGLVQRAKQRACVIQRRRILPSLIKAQLLDGPAELHFVEVISSIHWPPMLQDNISIAELDFARLRDALVGAGCISAKADWRAPDAGAIAASLHAGLPPGTRLIAEGERSNWLRSQRRERQPTKAFKS